MTTKSTVDTLLNKKQSNPKDQAVHQLGVASELVRLGESAKKKAKEALTGFGIISKAERTPGKERVYESKSFIVEADTAQPGAMLDEAALRKSIRRVAGITTLSVIDQIIREATVPKKAATTYRVTVK